MHRDVRVGGDMALTMVSERGSGAARVATRPGLATRPAEYFNVNASLGVRAVLRGCTLTTVTYSIMDRQLALAASTPCGGGGGVIGAALSTMVLPGLGAVGPTLVGLDFERGPAERAPSTNAVREVGGGGSWADLASCGMRGLASSVKRVRLQWCPSDALARLSGSFDTLRWPWLPGVRACVNVGVECRSGDTGASRGEVRWSLGLAIDAL